MNLCHKKGKLKIKKQNVFIRKDSLLDTASEKDSKEVENLWTLVSYYIVKHYKMISKHPSHYEF